MKIMKYNDIISCVDRSGMPCILFSSKNGANKEIFFKDFASCGYTVHKTNVDLSWLPSGEIVFPDLDINIKEILTACPEAEIILEVHTNAPDWWLKEHPEEAHTGQDGAIYGQSMASKIWQDMTRDVLRRAVKEISSRPWAGRVIMFFIGAGHTSEWFYRGAQLYGMVDESTPMRAGFCEWLKEEYNNDIKALNDAWGFNRKKMILLNDFSEATIPTMHEQRRGDFGSFNDPAVSRGKADFYRYLSYVIAKFIDNLCYDIKNSWSNDILTGVFYGHTLDWISNPFIAQRIGHLALSEVLRSKHLDIIAGPNGYLNRNPGYQAPISGPVNSVALHEKLWVAECDTRTHLAGEVQELCGKPNNAETSINLLKRDLAQVLCRGTDALWFSLIDGWFHDPFLLEYFSQARKIIDQVAQLDRSSGAEVAVFVDEESCFWQVALGSYSVSPFITRESRLTDILDRTGTPYDIFLLKDLPEVDLDKYRVCLFVNCYAVPDNIRQYIDNNVKKSGRTLIWFYAPGFVSKDSLSTDAMSDLTGMCFNVSVESRSLFLDLRNSTDSQIAGLKDLGWVEPNWVHMDAEGRFGSIQELTPWFNVTGIEGIVGNFEELGSYVGGGCGFARAIFPDWNSIYIGTPYAPAVLLRHLFASAGVHLFMDNDDIIYINKSIIGIHGWETGERTIRLKQTLDVIDLFSGERIDKADSFTINIKRGETRLFLLDK